MKKSKLRALNKLIMLIGACLLWSYSYAQDEPITVTGTVTDAQTNEPLPGVVIVVEGSTSGTQTDIDGNFSISAAPNATLIVTYAGYTEKKVPVNGQTTVNIPMGEDAQMLTEVVAIGYGTQEKSDVTGSISTVKTKDLTQVVVTNPSQAIQGRVTGVTVSQNTGAPGSPLTIRVRGVGTIGNSNPLYVVNGVPVDDINFLNSNDIESIDILKDASAASVYGSRAANGVVLVTTRRGSERNPNIEFRYLTGISSAWRQRNLLDGREWATLKNEARLREGQPLYNLDTIGAGTDWQKEIFRDARMNTYYLSASGGAEKYNYYVSGSFLQQEGIIKKSDYERFNFNANADYQLSNKIKLGTFVSTAFFDQNRVYDEEPYNSVISTALSQSPLVPIYNPFRGGDSIYASGQAHTDVPNTMNILQNRSNNNVNGLHFLGNWFAEYEIIKGLKFKSSLGYIFRNEVTNRYTGRYYVSGVERQDESIVQRTNNNYQTVIWENSLGYDHTFGEKHKVGALLLTGLQDNKSEFFSAQKTNTVSNDPSQWYLGAASGSATVGGNATQNSLLSYFGRINYSYDDRYLFTANIRRDGSSRFPSANRWGNFPSFAAGWKVSNEEFFSGLKGVISFFKIRGSYGKLGNQNIFGGDYPYTTNIYQNQSYPLNNSLGNGAAPLGAGNNNIKWETVTTGNVAVDLGFLNDRILFTADLFTKKTTDMLIRRRVPGVTGYQEAPYVNYGEMVNNGLELYAEYRNQEHAFKYRLGANFTKINNEVTRLGDPIIDGQYRTYFVNQTAEGRSVAEFFGYVTDGIVQTAEEAASLQRAQPNVEAGDFKFKDLDGNGIINENDRTYLGSPLPEFTYGFTADFSFKGFDLVAFFQGVQGNKLFNGSKHTLESGGPNTNYSEIMLDRWTGPGTSNDIPRITNNDPNQNRRVSSYYIEDGSYLRLRTLQLGYTIPEVLSKKIFVKNLRVFIAAQNLLTITKYTGLDPEIGTNNYGVAGNPQPSTLDVGIDRGGTYPQARTFQVGVNAVF